MDVHSEPSSERERQTIITLTRIRRGRLTLRTAIPGALLYCARISDGQVVLDPQQPPHAPRVLVPVTQKRRITLITEIRQRARFRDGAQLVVLTLTSPHRTRFVILADHALATSGNHPAWPQGF